MTPFTGAWYNPKYDGEGFNFASDGNKAIVYYYTYDNAGRQKWYMAVCDRTGDTLTGTLLETEGGGLQAVTNPDSVETSEVGTIELVFNGTWTFEATINGVDVGYSLYSLFGTEIVINPPVEPEPEPEPDPEPEPENPFEGKFTFELKGWKRPDFSPGEFVFQDGKWYAVWSTSQIRHSLLRSGKNRVLSLRINALEQVSFVNSGASGYGNARIEDLPGFIPAGETEEFDFVLDKEDEPNGHENANFQVNTQWGTIVLFTARIMSG